MAKSAPDPQPSIEHLLAERAQYEEWLAKLDASGNRAPGPVRDRVRSDYQTRLHAVIEQLRQHGATIAAELERRRGARLELDGRRAKMEEELAEAEIRYAVGEFDDAGWQQINERSGRELERLHGELGTMDAEIARLAEVQGLISAERPLAAAEPSGQPAAASPAPAGSTPRVPVETIEPPAGPPATPSAPRFVPRRGERDQAARGAPAARAPDPADEMAFLKSMADPDEKEKRSPGRRSLDNIVRASEGRTEQRGDSARGAEADRDDAVTPQTGGAPRGGSPVAKTLKCADCGTLNRPTEWYCERCGAELAAM